MSKKQKKEVVRGAYFEWRLGQRNGVWQADGRSNRPNVGRHSLDTKDHKEALTRVQELDRVKAVEFKMADRSILAHDQGTLLPLAEGRKQYLQYVGRSPGVDGPVRSTATRYKPVFDKFARFASECRIIYWQQVTNTVLERYRGWLYDKNYAPRTLDLETITIKQAVKWMVREGLVPSTCLLTTRVSKVRGTNTYCYTAEEVRAIVSFCQARPDPGWLGDVVVALATTGLRISELVGLRWSNVDFEARTIRLRDTSGLVPKSRRAEAQTTKSHRDRTLDIHPDLLPALQRLYESRRSDHRVFHGPRGGMLKDDTVRTILRRDVLSALAGRFPGTDGRPGITAGRVHSFRHYFASLAANSNVPEPTLMEWLGHQESRMIRHYYHLQRDESRRQMGKIPSLGIREPLTDPKEITRPAVE